MRRAVDDGARRRPPFGASSGRGAPAAGTCGTGGVGGVAAGADDAEENVRELPARAKGHPNGIGGGVRVAVLRGVAPRGSGAGRRATAARGLHAMSAKDWTGASRARGGGRARATMSA